MSQYIKSQDGLVSKVSKAHSVAIRFYIKNDDITIKFVSQGKDGWESETFTVSFRDAQDVYSACTKAFDKPARDNELVYKDNKANRRAGKAGVKWANEVKFSHAFTR